VGKVEYTKGINLCDNLVADFSKDIKRQCW